MEALLLLLVFPIIWPFVAKYTIFKSKDNSVYHQSKYYGRFKVRGGTSEITWGELGLNVLIVVALVSMVMVGGLYMGVRDHEIINGKVTGKEKDRVSCEHSYSCNCTTDSKGHTSCQTCYDHPYDFDWVVHSNIGRFYIDRIDRQGKREPPRWTAVQINEPVSRGNSYVNYIKAAPDSLFSKTEYAHNKWIDKVPLYPNSFYDYWHIDRVFGVEQPRVWNEYLHEKLKEVGPAKQANVVIIVANADETYADAINYRWLGGKKNDVVVVIGSADKKNIDWVKVVSWAKDNVFHVRLRDSLMEAKVLEPVQTIDLIIDHVWKGFKRREMKEFEYLKFQIDPPDWLIGLAAFLAVFGSIGLSFIFHRKEVA